METLYTKVEHAVKLNWVDHVYICEG